MSQIPEERSATGKPMVPATPRDVVHIRIGSFVLFFTIMIGVLAALMGSFVLSIVLWLAAVGVAVDIALAVRRQRRYGGGPEGLE
jgi:hypothetical protein